jgi:hypothetical protein
VIKLWFVASNSNGGHSVPFKSNISIQNSKQRHRRTSLARSRNGLDVPPESTAIHPRHLNLEFITRLESCLLQGIDPAAHELTLPVILLFGKTHYDTGRAVSATFVRAGKWKLKIWMR